MGAAPMKIIHRYLLTLLLRNFAIGLAMFTFLFLMVDFFDRLDNVLAEKASAGLVFLYFLYKLPLMTNLMLPVACMFSVLFTFGLLSKNSEITAMRASGLTIAWLGRPLLGFALILSIFSLVLGELVVPVSERRQKELYNIDIRQKDKRGGYSQTDFWWRRGNQFFSVDLFDSRSDTLHELTQLEINAAWQVIKRTDAEEVTWLDPLVGWNMKDVSIHHFDTDPVSFEKLQSLPLPIKEKPQDFYDFRTEPSTMGFFELRKFIKDQHRNGIATTQYLPDLYNKLAFPLVILITAFVVLPFTVRPARSGSLAFSSLAAIFIAFTYFAVDSFSISMGRAELLPPVLAAWMANIIMGIVALVLNLGAEAPN
jgi:lipopolysaccharide export system permease protein